MGVNSKANTNNTVTEDNLSALENLDEGIV